MGIASMFEFRKDVWQRSEMAEAGPLAGKVLTEIVSGLVAGTKVATQIGWRDVAGVAVGDKVLTFDGGMRTVASIDRQIIATMGEYTHCNAWPLLVPTEALGNRDPMIILPQQSIMIESDVAEEVFDDPFAMIPALALEGFRGIKRVPPATQIEIVTLVFAQDEVVFCDIGALIFCPWSCDLIDAGLSVYSTLSMDVANALVMVMELDGMGEVCIQPPHQYAA
jgi:hypothetical protein